MNHMTKRVLLIFSQHSFNVMRKLAFARRNYGVLERNAAQYVTHIEFLSDSTGYLINSKRETLHALK